MGGFGRGATQGRPHTGGPSSGVGVQRTNQPTMNLNLRNWFGDDDRAVSPVIGVILMVAVTVILAAVVSMLVLDMGNNVQSAPQATFAFDSVANGSQYDVTITHQGGDPINTSQVQIVGGGVDETWNAGVINAGDSKTITVNSGSTVRLIWKDSNGDTSILSTYKVPS